jgi:hypothetical protein
LIDPKHSKRWLSGKTPLWRALNRDAALLKSLEKKYKGRISTVGDYYKLNQRSRSKIDIEDILKYIKTFGSLPTEGEQHEAYSVERVKV